MTVSGLLLAAGSGSRLGTPKAEVVLDGLSLLDRALGVLRRSCCDEIIAVLRASEPIAGVTTIVNPEPDRGMGSSLRLGLAACTGEIAVIMLVDTPGIGPDAIDAVVARVQNDATVAIASFAGRQVPPVAIAAQWWPEVARLAVGDQGARGFLRAHPELVTAVACGGDPGDIDTQDDLAGWRG